MKKILAMILIMSVMAMGFSAVVDTATLTINTTVDEVNEIGIFDEAVTTTEAFVAGSKAVTKYLPNIDPTDTDTKVLDKLYLAVRTNRTDALTVEITLGDLENGSDVMKYGTTFDTAHGNAGLLVLSGDVHSLVVPASTGLQIYNFPFQVSITNAQYSSSIPNSYSATIMFKYTSL